MRSIVNAFNKVADLLHILASLEGIFIIPAIFFQVLKYNDLIFSQKLAVFNLIMIIVLVLRYSLWRYRTCWFVGVFFAWAYVTAAYNGAELFKIFGCVNMRAWYLAIVLCLTALVMDNKSRRKWLYCVCAAGVVSATSLFYVYVVKATRELLFITCKSDARWGIIKSGRLHAMGNANTVGCEAAAAVLMSVWLVYASIERLKEAKQMKQKIAASAWLIAVGIWFFAGVSDLVALSLSGSRGSILATSFGIGVMVCSMVARRVTGTLKRLGISASALMLACIATVIIAYGPKQVYDAAIEHYADTCRSEILHSKTEVMERLKPLGVTYEVGTLTDRTLIWRAVFDNMNEQPDLWITGVTAPKAAYTYVQDVYENRPDKPAVHTHNGYMQVLLLYGIPGALILGVMLIDWIIAGIKAFFKWCREGNWCALVVAFAVAAMVEGMVEIFPFPYTSAYSLTFLFFIAVGTCIGINEGVDNEQSKEQII